MKCLRGGHENQLPTEVGCASIPCAGVGAVGDTLPKATGSHQRRAGHRWLDAVVGRSASVARGVDRELPREVLVRVSTFIAIKRNCGGGLAQRGHDAV